MSCKPCMSQFYETRPEAYPADIEKYARGKEGDQVVLDAFSNGAHSSTMCISMRTNIGRHKQNMIERRDRGIKMRIEDIKEETAKQGRYSAQHEGHHQI